jgi:hypothetical protein
MFYYDDEIPFPESADGGGYTLSASEANPTLGLDNYRYWMASSVIDGSPFADDPTLVGIESVASTGNGIFIMFPNPCSRYLIVENSDVKTSGRNHLTFISLAGQVVYECDFEDNITIDLAGILPVNGLYIVNIKGENINQTGIITWTF